MFGKWQSQPGTAFRAEPSTAEPGQFFPTVNADRLQVKQKRRGPSGSGRGLGALPSSPPPVPAEIQSVDSALPGPMFIFPCDLIPASTRGRRGDRASGQEL